jgi:hypothetical protein
MQIIFLDIDGVLNSRDFYNRSENDPSFDGLAWGGGQLDTQALQRLDRLVRTSGAFIVISSSWRHIWNFHEIAKMFAERGFKSSDRIISQTPSSKSGHRGTELQDWLDTDAERARIDDGGSQTLSYVILDDSSDFNRDQMPRFVHTNPNHGLTDQDVQRALTILRQA